jgi:hypothetical protein
VLVGVVFSLYGYPAQLTFAEANMQREMSGNNSGADDLISPISEWVGIAAIGMTVGLVISIRIKFSYNNSSTHLLRRTILASATILSISVGIIHLLLIKEHMTESHMWGIGFLSMGISQIVYGLIMIFAKKFLSSAKTVLYNIGISGNALFIGMFIYVRLFVPPFSPDGTPVNELQTNGILTVIIQLILIVTLIYLVKCNIAKKQPTSLAPRMEQPNQGQT